MIGQHLHSQLGGKVDQLNLWTLKDKFSDRLEVNQNVANVNVRCFTGIDQLVHAIEGCDVVINTHEAQDFTLTPNEELLKEQNVNFVNTLLSLCSAMKIGQLVQLSSTFVQCSGQWPNVGNRELEFTAENPYPSYSRSKFEAENLCAHEEKVKTLVVRLGPVYGEGDECSLICDLIKIRNKLGFIPRIGLQHGVVQLTYAGNVADAIIKCSAKMSSFKSQHEIVNIVDGTPVTSIYEGISGELLSEYFSRFTLPFTLIYPIYFFIFIMSYFMPNKFENIPSFSHLYMICRQWTSLVNYRLRLLFDYIPQTPPKESLHRSLEYYNNLDSSRISNYSWNNMST